MFSLEFPLCITREQSRCSARWALCTLISELMLFLLPRKRNKLLCSCGVFISLSTNSRRLINTPLDSKSLYVNFFKAKEIKRKRKFNYTLTCQFWFESIQKRKRLCYKTTGSSFWIFGSNIQFVESVFRETSQRTDQSMLFFLVGKKGRTKA